MKKKKLDLSFNKEVVSKLQMKNVKGGGTDWTCDGCLDTLLCNYSNDCNPLSKDCNNVSKTTCDGCISWWTEDDTCFNCQIM